MTPPSVEITPGAREVAAHLRSVLGGNVTAASFGDRDETTVTVLLESTGSPAPGLRTCSTLLLHRAPNLLDGKDIRVELVACGQEAAVEIANVIATAAFTVLKDGWLAAPGVVFPELVGEYVRGTTTPHVMWSEPVSFPGLSTVTLQDVGDVRWLQAVPLSDAEVAFLHEHGYDALEERLAAADVELVDLFRASVV